MQISMINRVKRELATGLTAAEKRLKAAEAAVFAAKEEYDAAHAEHAAIQSQHQKFSEIFGATETNGTGGRKASTNGRKAQGRKAAKTATKAGTKKTTAKAGTSRTESGLTMVERMIKVMSNKTMTAGDVEEALIEKGLNPDSGNLRAYISSVFSSAKVNGQKAFEAVKRGEYRVNPKVAAAAAKTIARKPATTKSDEDEGTTEDETTETTQTAASPAAQLLAEAGLDVASIESSSEQQPLA